MIGVDALGSKALKQCKHIGCRNLTKDTYCDKHKRVKPKTEYESKRPNANRRGYTYKWNQYSKAYLLHHPLCVECLKNGDLTPSEVVDHIKDHRGDKRLFWDKKNHQALCKRCHDKKTATTERKGSWY